jgi:hypothetical protein
MKSTSQSAVFCLHNNDASSGRLFALFRKAIFILTVLWVVLSGAAALSAEDLDSDGDVDGRDLWQYIDAGIFSDIGLFAEAYGGSDPGDDWWQPDVSDTWQWQLDGTVNSAYDVDVYDIDMFESSAELIQDLHDSGRKVVCYFSAGSYENWRPDTGAFKEEDLGVAVGGWPGERWIDIRSDNVRAIMKARLDLARQKGCDGVEPDWLDSYLNNTGFPLTADDQLDYNRFLAQEAHSRRLTIALKNDIDQVAELVDAFDFAVNEQCHEYDECDSLEPFINAGKPVFNAEYADDFVNDAAARQALCADARNHDFRTLVLPLDLDDTFRYSCDADSDPLPYGLGTANGPQGNWLLKLNDNFDGTALDTSIWSTGWHGAGITPPVQSQELACYDPAQVQVSDGILKLKAVSKSTSCGGQTRPYVSGAIISYNKQEFSYGYFEARIWLDASSSAIYNWPAWWLDGHNWPVDGELDIMEGLGGDAKATWHGPQNNGAGHRFGDAGVLSGWHVFAAEWQPGKVTSYYDGAKLGEYSSTTNITASPQYLILMAQIGPQGEWGGPVNIPSEMDVDYVRVWQRE